MLFNSIKLENFGCISSFTKELNKGILVLQGQNGMGKSTVLKAILLAVFDDYEGVLQDYIKWDTTYFLVIVSFTHKGIAYKSTVHYDGIHSTTDRTLAFNDKVLKGNEAKRALKEIVDQDLLKAGMIAMEQRVAIVETKPAQRREYLKRIYDIGFKKQLLDLDDDVHSLEIQIAQKTTQKLDIESRHYDIPTRPEYPFTKAQYDIAVVKLENERLRLHKAQDSIKSRNDIIKHIESLQKEMSIVSSAIKKLDTRIDTNSKALDTLPIDKDKKAKSYHDIIDKAQSSIIQESSLYESSKVDLTKQLKSIVMERLPVFDQDKYTSLSQKLYSDKAHLAQLQNAKDICPMCGQSITSPEHIAKRKEEIALLEDTIAQETALYKELETKRTCRETRENNNRKREKDRIELEHRLEILEEKHTTTLIGLQSRIDNANDCLIHLDDEYSARECSLRELLNIDSDNRSSQEERLKAITESIKDSQDKLLQIEELPIDTIRQEVLQLESRIKSYDDTTTRIEEIEHIEQRVQAHKAEYANEILLLNGTLKELNQTLGDRKEAIRIFKTDFPIYVISRVIRDIEKSMNDFLKLTYPKYTIQIQDKKNALCIVYGPKKRDVSSASGFERQIFSLSFMFAISHAIGNRCMILDEADSSATDKNSSIFYRVLGDSIGNGIEQVILISHKQSTRDILQYDYGAEIVTFNEGVSY